MNKNIIRCIVLLFLPATVFAQAATGQGPSLIENLLPIAVMIGVFYFLLIRPQAKKQKDHLKFLGDLKRGEQVITSGGILGTIEGLTDKFVTLEISNGVKIRILRAQILSTYNPNAASTQVTESRA